MYVGLFPTFFSAWLNVVNTESTSISINHSINQSINQSINHIKETRISVYLYPFCRI